MVETCENCKFVYVLVHTWPRSKGRELDIVASREDREGRKSYYCRRYPPTYAIYTNDNGEVNSDKCVPHVDGGDWCGEWLPKPPAEKPSNVTE
jgi:hypothetical protein